MSLMFTVVWCDDCKWCDRAKELLVSKGRGFTPVEFNAEMKPLFAALGLTTLPQIWHGSFHVGGYSDLVEFLNAR